MDKVLFESLLHDSEGSSLDFKRGQYAFESASDYQKAELLKDILAFANGVRSGDARILIGVDEVKGGRSEPVGVSRHLDDASLQQFVNAKTNRRIVFAYEAREFDGASIGIITIPAQDGPFYLKNDYGKLRKNIVYRRQGSSMAEATPDDIVAIAKTAKLSPTVDFQFATGGERDKLGRAPVFAFSRLTKMEHEDIRDYRIHTPLGVLLSDRANPDYYRNMNARLFMKSISKSIGFYVCNESAELLSGLRLEIRINKIYGFLPLAQDHFPRTPPKTYDFLGNLSCAAVERTTWNPDIVLEDEGGTWRIDVTFGNVQPKAQAWTREIIYLCAGKSMAVDMEAVAFADNLAQPQRWPLKVTFDVTQGGEISYDLLDNQP